MTSNNQTDKTITNNQRINRREALKWGAAMGGTVLSIPAILSACGGTNNLVSTNTPAATTEKTLRVYWNPGHAYQTYKDVIAKFETDHPGWKVKLSNISGLICAPSY